ncbi:MAG TPA: carbonic anhydrase [Abditibacteriaceae bacterium]|nr:carbonic anhydrase [Abditibacteriaceae bacterium]
MMDKQNEKKRCRMSLSGSAALLGSLLLWTEVTHADEAVAPQPPTAATRTQPVLPAPEPDSALADLIKKGATMEEVARLRDPVATTPKDALRALKSGNARFYGGVARRPDMSANERRAQILSQTPFAVVLGCSDSRVPTELVYDQGLGSIFSIRVAGNVVEPATAGSIEYAVTHLKSHIVVVMGHEGCGAVKAAMLPATQRNAEPANVRFLLDRIVPSVSNLPPIRDEKARMREAVIANVRLQVHLLKQNPVVAQAIKNGKITVVGAFYEIGSGAVDFLETPEELRLSAAELRGVAQQVRLSARAPQHRHAPAPQAAAPQKHGHAHR